MSLEFRHHHPTLDTQPPEFASGDAPANEAAANPNVLVTHGIHRGHFPVAGMTVAEARAAMQRLMPIDAEAVAVIDGARVTDDTVIGSHVTMLAFVKPSSIKG